MLSDPSFYYVAIPAVILVGLTKGGMGEALALLGVPILAMIMPPVQAAAILLPILIVMDMVALWAWRGFYDKATLINLLPGGILGIVAGWATSALVPGHIMRLIIGTVAILFFLRYALNRWKQMRDPTPVAPLGQRPVQAGIWGALAGYGSFVAHAGGAPYQVYTLPLKLDPKSFTGTGVRFFAIMNALKLIPYFALGQLDTTNLKASLVLLPFAPLATFTGAWAVKRMKPEIFYPYMYLMVLLAGSKLLYDGIISLISH